MTLALFSKSAPSASAYFSPCRHCGSRTCGLESDYRYDLRRTWDPEGTRCTFVALNPSTATATVDDNTIRKCVKFARAWGYGEFQMLNVFAWRSTDPHVLPSLEDPIGPENDEFILREARMAGIVVCAWGRHAGLGDRGRQVLAMLHAAGIETYALKVNASDGSPSHPLYLPDVSKPVRYAPEGAFARPR